MNTKGLWLALSKIDGIGAVRFKNLLAHFGSIENVCNADIKALEEVEGISANIAQNIVNIKKQTDIDTELKKIKEKGINIITIDNQDYPLLLKEIYDSPPILYYRGNYSPFIFEKSLAIVGTRYATTYGREIAKNLAEELVKHGITVVSGMAAGIDTAAHKGALNAQGKTVAVLGCGPDIIYPALNRELYDQLIKNGVVISEYPQGTMPEAGRFPARNRIISGLSKGVIIVEAPEKSGALITADFAIEQGREVFVVPGNINNPKNKGCHNLIRQGAILITDIKNILDELGWVENINQTAKINKMPLNLTEKEQKMYSFLTFEPLHIDVILQKSDINSAEIMQILLMLELKGIIQQLPGKFFIIKPTY